MRISPATSCGILSAILALTACENIPKHKKSNGHFDQWASYEGKNFAPKDGKLAGVDAAAGMVFIESHGERHSYSVTPETRIMNEGNDIALSQLPLNQSIKYTVSHDDQRLLTIWYGHATHGPAHETRRKQERTDLF